MRRLVILALALALVVDLAAGESQLPPLVYVPYEKTPATKLAGQGVFLPYERFVKLWDAAHPDRRPELEPEPPVAAALAGYTLTGQVSGEAAELKLEAVASALAKGWSSIELPEGLALGSFQPEDARLTLERLPAAVPAKAGKAVEVRSGRLLLHLPGPGSWRFSAVVAAPVSRDAAGRRTLDLVLPVAAAGRLDLTIPGDVEVALEPAVAATRLPGQEATRVQAVLGGARNLAVAWQPPLREAAGDAMLVADLRIPLEVRERSLACRLSGSVTVSRRAVRDLTLQVPAEWQVLSASARNLRSWERGEGTVQLRLHEAVEGELGFQLELERQLPASQPGVARALSAALPSLAGAARCSGLLTLHQGEGLAVAVGPVEGLSQVDTRGLGDDPPLAAWRFQIPPAALAFTATRLQSELRAGLHQLVRLGVEEDRIAVRLDLDVRRAGLFALALQVPAAWELADQDGLAVDDIRPGPVEGAHRRLDLQLKGRLLGEGSLTLRFRAPPSVPRDAAPVRLPAGLASLLGARSLRGSLVVAAPRSWAISSAQRRNLTAAEPETLRREGPLVQALRELPADEEAALAFTFIGSDPAADLALAPRPRELVVRQEELLTLAEGGLRRSIAWRGEVRYSALAALRIQAPTALDARLAFKGPAIAEQAVVERTAGSSTWELRLRSPLLGAFQVVAEWPSELVSASAGLAVQVPVEPLRLLDATRSSWICAVAREGTLEVGVAGGGLESVAPGDLPATLQGQGVVAAFQAGVPAALTLSLTRHDLLPLADAAVAEARWQAVLGDDQVLRVRGDLDLVSRGRPYLALLLPQGAELLETAVDARQVRPSRRSDGALLIQLGSAPGLSTRRISLRYDQILAPGRLGSLARLAFDLPRMASGGAEAAEGARPVPVGRNRLNLQVPPEVRAWGWTGDFALTTPASFPVVEGLTVPLPAGGTPFSLERLGDGGSLGFRCLAAGLQWTMAVLAAAGALVCGWLLRRRPQTLGVAIVVALVLLALAGGPWLLPVLGLVAGITLGSGLALVAAWRSRRA